MHIPTPTIGFDPAWTVEPDTLLCSHCERPFTETETSIDAWLYPPTLYREDFERAVKVFNDNSSPENRVSFAELLHAFVLSPDLLRQPVMCRSRVPNIRLHLRCIPNYLPHVPEEHREPLREIGELLHLRERGEL